MSYKENFGPDSIGYAVYLTPEELKALLSLKSHLDTCMLEDFDQRVGLRVFAGVLDEIQAKEFILPEVP